MLGAPATDAPELARQASPLTHVRRGGPPTLLVHGDADVLVPAAQSRRLHAALLAAEVSSTLEILPGYSHMLTGVPDADLEALVDRTASFLLDHATGPVDPAAATTGAP